MKLGLILEGFLKSLGVIFASEIGDKTFFIAAIMAMQHPRLLVFVGCAGALVVMTILSTAFGAVAPKLIPQMYTHYASIILFFYFGLVSLKDVFYKQITTISLAAAQSAVGVTLGGSLGHTLCTGAAVLGGRQLASVIDPRTVNIVGGVLFLLFGALALYEGPELTPVR